MTHEELTPPFGQALGAHVCTVPARIQDATTRSDSQPYPREEAVLCSQHLPLSWRDHPQGLQWLQRICLEPKGKRNIDSFIQESNQTSISKSSLSYAVAFFYCSLATHYLKCRCQIHLETHTGREDSANSYRSDQQVTIPVPVSKLMKLQVS